MDIVQQIIEYIKERVYIWQYAEYEYPNIEDYMYKTCGKDVSKVTGKCLWVLGEHVFFTFSENLVLYKNKHGNWSEFRHDKLCKLLKILTCVEPKKINSSDIITL